MMPNGSQASNLWATQQQWFATSYAQEQMQGISNMNFPMMTAQQIPNLYSGGSIPVWNASPQQWAGLQWQANFPTNWSNAIMPNSQPPPPPPPNQPSFDSQLPPLPEGSPHHPAVLSDEEKNFDNQFREWEEKFQKWKEENKNHPDKTALAGYEAQWKTWREHLIQNREKLRKQREESEKVQIPITPTSQSGLANLHLNPQTMQFTGTPLTNLAQHNAFSNIGQASLNSSTSFPHSSIQTNTQRYQDGDSYQLANLNSKQSSTNAVHFRQDETSQRSLHDKSHERHAHHSSNLQSQFLPDPLFRTTQDDSKYQNANNSWRPDVSSNYSISEQPKCESDRSRPPIVPQTRRDLNIPQSNQLSIQSFDDATQRALPYKPDSNDPQSFLSESSGDTPAELFRKRALRGKLDRQQRAAPYHAPETCLDRRLVSNGSPFSSATRSKFEEHSLVVGHAEIPLSGSLPLSRQELDDMRVTISRSPVPPPMNLVNVIEPVVFEYNHRPGRNGRFLVSNNEPVSIDYAHGKRVPPKEPLENLAISRKIEVEILPKRSEILPISKTTFDKIIIDQSPIKTVPLFPSAAAIQAEDSLPLSKPLLIPNPALEKGLNSTYGDKKEAPKTNNATVEIEVVMVEDLLLPPGRYGRPSKIVVILRGLPGSGKSHLARLIKEKEVLMGGSAPRILSIDDYYLMDDGSSPVGWQEDQEEKYRQSLLKSLKRNLEDGHFSFIIVDALNIKASDVSEIYTTARSRAFAVFLVDLIDNSRPATTRKCSDKDIEKMKNDWQQAPNDIARLDIRWLVQETTREPIRSPEDIVTSTTIVDEDSHGSSSATPTVSKWEMMEQTGEKLDRLDGIVKRKLENPASMEDWLQSGLPDDYDQRKCIDGKKRVRWADVEEQIQQKKIRDLGFVVGQTNWSRMTDQNCGESALTKTKYI